MSGTSEVTVLPARFQQATAELTIPGASRDGLWEQLANAANGLDPCWQVYFGSILEVGQDSLGRSWVYYNDMASHNGYSSVWPQWAYELAQAALLSGPAGPGKWVSLVANGLPFGDNLINVWIVA